MNTKNLIQAISELNLEPIKTKLMHVPSGEGWSRAKADAVEKEYRRFLVLMKLYPNEDTAPSVDVDTFWHYHILDTMKYAADCEQALGGFLHHYPYVGLRGEADQQFRLDSGARMQDLYETTFKEPYPGSRTPPAPAARSLATVAAPYYEQQPLAMQPAGSPTAWCAGPHGPKNGAKAQAGSDTAWCAGPHGPKIEAQAQTGSDTAWCAGPHGPKIDAKAQAGSDTAWCAGPHGPKIEAQAQTGSDTAWCAGPHGPKIEAQAQTGSDTAWCAGPHGPKIDAKAQAGSDTAWCAGPHGPKIDAQAQAGSDHIVH